MKIELFYFDGCPSYERALQNVKDALLAERLPEDIETVCVGSEAEADAQRFLGSPTIRVNGVDLEGPEADARGYAFGCRVYRDGNESVGWPSVTQVRQALRRESASERADAV